MDLGMKIRRKLIRDLKVSNNIAIKITDKYVVKIIGIYKWEVEKIAKYFKTDPINMIEFHYNPCGWFGIASTLTINDPLKLDKLYNDIEKGDD